MTNEAATHSVATWLLDLLQCPECGQRLARSNGGLVCAGCNGMVPVRNGLPVFVDERAERVDRRTQASFGYEWTHFSEWQPSGEMNFRDYFSEFDLAAIASATVLDAGCGMGRHARFVAPRAEHVVALDFSAAIERAADNLAEFTNAACVRADLQRPPFGNESFDFIYSFGVLHHLEDTEKAILALITKLRPGGRLRIYVYWAQEGWKRRLLRVVSAVRRVTTRMPFGLLRVCCWILSLALLVTVVVPYRVLLLLGIRGHREWPLFVYTKYPFRVLYNDQFDRFSAPIEKRYTEGEARLLLLRAGLDQVRVIPRFGWIVEGRKPA